MSEKKLTKWQFISIGVFFMMGTILHTSFVSAIAGRDAWLIPIMGFVMFLPTLIFCWRIGNMFPNTGLYEINELVFGNIGGRIVTFLYFLFFLNVATLNHVEMSAFSATYLLRGTPIVVCGIMIVMAAVYAIKKGIITVGRASGALVILMLVLNAISFIQAIPQMDIDFTAPAMVQSPGVYARSSHISSTIMYGEGLALMVFAGRTGKKVNMGKSMLIIMLIAMVYMIQIHLREVLLLGPLVQFTRLPSLEAARMTGKSDTVSRTESIYSLIMLLCSLFRVLISFFVSLSALRKVFRLKTYQALVVPMAAFIAAYSLYALESPEDSYFYAVNTTPFIWALFTFVLPMFTLVIAVIKRKAKLPDRGGAV
ncbi:MAG: endospore germination permease [Oscillospiraceae bacterium]|jgi:spore germination protein KB|nr:endospore germination permease [Oscillospiraceae bacterium]